MRRKTLPHILIAALLAAAFPFLISACADPQNDKAAQYTWLASKHGGRRHLDDWVDRKILILGMTYPSYSRKYAENVCTGGLVDGSLEMIRLHPFYLRYLPEDKRPSAFQWISVKTKKHTGDPRPESYRVQPESIELLDDIPATEAAARRSLLERSPHFCASLEDLQERQSRTGMSLGIIQPAAVLDCDIKQRSAAERNE